MRNAIKPFLSLCLAAFLSVTAFAQIKTITVSGTVSDASGEPLIGVNVVVKNQPGFGVTTDLDGKYSIRAGVNDVLIFSYVGYEDLEIPINNQATVNAIMEQGTALEEAVVVAGGYQRKVSVVGSISSVKIEDIKVPTSSIANSLAGNVPGIIAVQRTGEPGKDASEFWIRGISTFGANSSALVLVDGIERNFNEINVEDIESFSVLKDASATAVYGQRGANGVVLITTKKGKEGKVDINLKTEYGISKNAYEREFVDASTYASLANEARQSRYMDPVYDASELEIIQYSLDPDLYPNVDWHDLLLKDYTTSYRATLNLSGGGSTARYFASASYYNQGGIYADEIQATYGKRTAYERINFRLNTDFNITKTTVLTVGIGGWVTSQILPGMNGANSDDFWRSISYMTPIAVPVQYSNGQYPTYGYTGYQISPYILLNKTGYQSGSESKMETNVGLRQDLGFITKGLAFQARLSYDGYNRQTLYRLTMPDLYRAEKSRDMNGELITRRMITGVPLHQYSSASGWRRTYGEMQLNYDRTFGKHRLGGLLFYYMQDFSEQAARGDSNSSADLFSAVPQRNLALSGRLTYGFDDRYLIEANFGYSGSENFQPGHKFGFFPAVAFGWVVSNESFVKNHAPWLNLLKIRYSLGQVGNDRITNGRFPYLTTLRTGASWGINFGNQGASGMTPIAIELMGAEGLTWEVATKQDLGIDLKIADRFDLTVDLFRDNRDNIYMRRSNLPGTAGVFVGDGFDQRPWGNVGAMMSEGIDGNFGYTQRFGRDLIMTLRGNLTYAHTRVLRYDEPADALWYRMTQGYKWTQNRGLIALSLFEDQADIDSSPSQYGYDLMPGDIKYKDVNGDGVVNDNDVVPIGHTRTPELIYGFGLSAQWKGFDMSVLFQGAALTDVVLEGFSVFPFYGGETGNVLVPVSDQKNRWTAREISGTADTERQDVLFPRLTYGQNPNNQKWSTWWLRDGRYLRLKNLEIGYTIPSVITKRARMDRVRIYFLGNNLACWAPFTWWDPEMNSSDGSVYPIQKTFTFGVNVSF